MSCEGCANPQGGLYIGGCRQCLLRMLAKSPGYFQSRVQRRMTPEFAAACAALGDVKAVGDEVKAMAKTITKGSIRA